MLGTKIARRLCATTFLSITITCCLIAEDSSDSPPSAFAPLGDLENQVDYFLQRIDKALEEESDYDDDRRKLVERDASTLAVIAFLITQHDQTGASTFKAPALLEGAQNLAESARDFAEAQAALLQVKEATAADEDTEPIEGDSVADLTVLMQQIPIVNNNLRRSVNGRRFKRSVDRAAGLAATLAALAHVSALDTSYCESEEDEELWRAICDQMRDSAAHVNIAVRAIDQTAARRGLDQLVETCDECHHRFRDP